MTVKIIQQGTLPELRPYRCECTHCRTVFEFLRSDAEYVSDQRDGDFLRIDCPFCGKACTVSALTPQRPSKR